MELPNRLAAYVPIEKITEYLLSESHAVGKSKAKFFRSFGFDEINVTLFEQRLLHIAHAGSVSEIKETTFGVKYIIDGTLETPRGVIIPLRTVWIIETGEEQPRFITAYPLD
ncbi:MAG: hypothetical protein AUJ21_08315 [Anaerolineae bacterium CG1_02_58_13]|nr:MAG: hypothetical protein AUJ21_08315 [Anaerolineae bacterium CG1_02_58_13]